MIFQFRANLFSTDFDCIADIMDKVLDHWGSVQTINPDTPNREDSNFEVINNHHDETPNGACIVTRSKTTHP